MNYYSADFHFGSQNMNDRWRRNPGDAEAFDKMLINNINEIVKPKDTLYIIGDVGKYHNSTSEKLKQINCKKILVVGNHDHPLLKHRSFRNIFERIEQNMVIIDDDYRIVLNHYPMAEWEGFYRDDTYHFYGHAHKGNIIMNMLEKAICVSVDCNEYIPKTAEQLISNKIVNRNGMTQEVIDFFMAYDKGAYGYQNQVL